MIGICRIFNRKPKHTSHGFIDVRCTAEAYQPPVERHLICVLRSGHDGDHAWRESAGYEKATTAIGQSGG